MLVLVALLACHPKNPPVDPETPSETAPPADPREAMRTALSVRDPEPHCADVEALSPTPVPDLLAMTEVELPPAVSIRAAGCLVEGHAAEVRADLVRWVTTPETRGLAILALDSLDKMPKDVAIEVATAALGGPLASDAKTRIARSTDPDIRALGGGQ
jgi:hypothetical protein